MSSTAEQREAGLLEPVIPDFLSQREVRGPVVGCTKELRFGGLFNTPSRHRHVGLEPKESKRNVTNKSFLCVG